ncbi:GNAT family N-acetyltransferase [Bradyrhizobium sp. Ghvi]|uniref:GNAT family N-acetyltransferase n=1 Tax=Bradyrhizobium sp. Ghvi TaxID=1855319 RepID=UPI000B88D015|nr:GNAT family N-acetyltransferase [Bradyrhizobium sp. Ghvi]
MDMSEFSFRRADRKDAKAVFELTKSSINGLAAASYSPAQIRNWMGDRTPEFYEKLIENGRMTVCLRGGAVVAFVDSEPGEVTRLFVLPEVAGFGLGRRLLEIGVAEARAGHTGAIRLEATLNAEGFYKKFGFRTVGRGHFSHGLGGDLIEIIHMEL